MTATHAPSDPCAKPGCTGGHKPGKCAGHRSDGSGRPCGSDPVRGARVCRMHGASAGQVKRAAQLRLLEAADDVAAELVRLALDKDVPPNVRRQAASDLLDRAGLGAQTRHLVEHVDLSDEQARHRELLQVQDELADLRGRKAAG